MFKVQASQIFTHSMEDCVAAKKLLDSGTSFLEVVEKYSTCPSKQNGGDLGWMPEGSLQSIMGSTVSENDKGKIIGPVHSQYGYHILMILDIEVERTQGPFTTATPMIEVSQKFPEVHSLLFKMFHLGFPVSGYKPEDTVGSISADQNKPEMEILNFLNAEYSTKHIPVLSPEEVDQKMRAGDPNLVLVDIRESWERDISKIEGAIFITRENSESTLNSLDKEKEIVLIDWRQDRSPSFQKWLSHKGFQNVKCLEGGIDLWALRVYPPIPRYDIDEDDGYRYEDILQENNPS